MVDWTQVILALVSMLGTVVTAFFATKAKGHADVATKSADTAQKSADVAVAASLRPPHD